MIPSSIVHDCSLLLAHLVASGARSLLLGCFAALALGALRVKGVAARLAVWTAVLYAALAMPLAGMVLPSISLSIPAAAVRFLSRSFGPVIASRAVEKSAAIRAMVSEPSTALPEASAARPGAHRSPTRGRVPIYTGPVNSDSSSLPYSGIVPLPTMTQEHPPIAWVAILSDLYFVVAILLIARLVLGVIFSGRLILSAHPIRDPDATGPLAARAREAGLAVPPLLAESDSISVPVTLGILRPVILFPMDWREWDGAALRAVIAHELSHVIRRDALTQRLSLLHRAVFWFSPLGWWLHRCLADSAEEASDEAALVSGADRARYAETLLGFFAALQETPRRVYWHGVSMAKAGQAERRVDRILAWKGDVSMRLNKLAVISLLFVGIPVALFAAAARPSVADTSVPTASLAITHDTQDQTGSPLAAPAVPAKPANPATPANPAPSVPPAPAAPVAPALPLAAQPPATRPIPAPTPIPLPAAIAPKDVTIPRVDLQLKDLMSDEQIQKMYREMNDAMTRVEKSKDFAKIQETVDLKVQKLQKQLTVDAPRVKVRGADGDFSDRFVIVSGDSPIFMSGDSQDVEHATSLRSKVTGDFIWFQRDEKSYLIHDQATVNRAKELFKPQQELGEKQQAFGKQQQALGDQQRELGKKMEAVRVQIPDMTTDMQKLEAEMKQLTAGGTQQQLGDLQRQIGELQRKIGQFQSQAGDQERQATEPMRALGQQQRDLGQQQRDLGRQQRDAARQARDQMKQLLDDAIAHGTAQPE